MKNTQTIFFSVLIFLFIEIVALSANEEINVRKFLECGKNVPNTAYLKTYHEEMQRTTPFDGVVLSLEATAPDKKRCSSLSIMDAAAWDPAWFRRAIVDLKACRFTTFTDNFIKLNFSPGKISWEDDSQWNVFCEKSAFCARVAKETGLKGLVLDFKPYGNSVFQYDYASGKPFAEVRNLVRQRGRQWMEAVGVEYPDMVILGLSFLDALPHLPGRRADVDPFSDHLLEQVRYGLLPSFFDGMLDALPSEMQLVDGCESGFFLDGEDDFNRRALALRTPDGPAIRLVAPENRKKYLRQLRVGFGCFLDMYVNSEESEHYYGPKEGGTRLDRLEDNLNAARNASDRYVWIYGEQCRWWPPRMSSSKPNSEWDDWKEMLPGLTTTIRLIKEPLKEGKLRVENLKKTGRAVNLFEKFETFENELKIESKNNGLSNEVPQDGNLEVSMTKEGGFFRNYPVKPGGYYFVSVDARQQGVGRIGLKIVWKNDKQEEIRRSETRFFSFEQAENRLRACGVVRVPDGVAVAQIRIEVRDQLSEHDIVRFDHFELIRIR